MKNKLIILIMLLPLVLTFVVFSMSSYASLKADVAVCGVEIELDDFVTLNQDNSSYLTVNANVQPSGATNKQVKYECEKLSLSDNVTWTILENGRINFSGYGKVKVKVTTVDGNYSDSIIVFVTSSSLIDFTLISSSENVKIGDNFSLSYRLYPLDSSLTSVRYTSSNPSVIEVSSVGECKAKKEGTAVITVTITSGEKTLTKTKSITVEGMGENEVALINGKNEAEEKTLATSHSFVASVNLNLLNENATINDFNFLYDSNHINNFELNYSISNNLLEYECNLSFNEEFYGKSTVTLCYLASPIASIVVERAEFLTKSDCDFSMLNDFVAMGTRGYFSISHPSDDRAYFEISSSSKDILQISQSGESIMYNAKNEGKVIVTATCYYGSEVKFTLSKEVSVVKVYSSFYFNEGVKDYYINYKAPFTLGNECVINGEIVSSSYELNVMADGVKARNDVISYSVSDSSIATLSGNVLTVLKEGKVTVTAQNVYGTQTGITTSASVVINCVLGVNVDSYSSLVTATESGKQVVLTSNIMLGEKVLTRKGDGSGILVENAGSILASSVKQIDTTSDWTYYKNNGYTTPPQVNYIIEFKNNVYGNGYSISGEYITNIIDSTLSPYSCAVFTGPLNLVSLTNVASVKAQDNIVFLIRKDNVTIYNTELRGCDGENIDDLNKLNYIGTVLEIMGNNVSIVGCNILNGRNCVRVFGSYDSSDKVISVNITQCSIRYAREFLIKMGSNKYILGDITSGTTTEEQYQLASPKLGSYNHLESNLGDSNFVNEYVKTYVNLSDSMLMTSGVFAIGMECKFAGICLDGAPYNSWDLDGSGWDDLAGTSYASVLNLSGDVRIYDWKKVSGIDSSTLIEVEGNDSHGLLFDIAGIIDTASNSNENIVSYYNNEKYIHGGIVLYGGGKNYSEVVNTAGTFNNYSIGFEAIEDERQRSIMTAAAGKEKFKFYSYNESLFSVERQMYEVSSGEAYNFFIK